MDASEGGNRNGETIPESLPHPSTAEVPGAPGAPVSAPTGAPAGAPPAKPLRDPKTGRILPGQTLNRDGRPKGTPNLNEQLCKAAKAWKLGDKSYMHLLLAKSLQDPEYAKLVVPRLFADATQAAPLIDASDNSQEHHHHSETHVHVAKLLTDGAGRDALARLAERGAACGAFTGGNGHGR